MYICVRGDTDEKMTVNGRRGEDLGISVVEVPEFPDSQLFDGGRLGLRRYPEARHWGNLSRPYGRGRTAKSTRGLHVCRNVGVRAVVDVRNSGVMQ